MLPRPAHSLPVDVLLDALRRLCGSASVLDDVEDGHAAEARLARLHLLRAEQRPAASVRDFVAELEDLLDRCLYEPALREAVAKDRLLLGLRSHDIRLHLLNSPPGTTYSQWRELAVRLDDEVRGSAITTTSSGDSVACCREVADDEGRCLGFQWRCLCCGQPITWGCSPCPACGGPCSKVNIILPYSRPSPCYSPSSPCCSPAAAALPGPSPSDLDAPSSPSWCFVCKQTGHTAEWYASPPLVDAAGKEVVEWRQRCDAPGRRSTYG